MSKLDELRAKAQQQTTDPVLLAAQGAEGLTPAPADKVAAAKASSTKAPQIKKVYKSHSLSIRYIFGHNKESTIFGKVASFVAHRYLTDHPDEIKELDAEIAMGNPAFYVDPNEETVDISKTPFEEMKEKIIAQFLADKKLALDAEGNISAYGDGKSFTGMNTSQITAGAAGSNSGMVPAASGK